MIKIGTRSSPLALAQAHQVRSVLIDHHPELQNQIEVITFTTSGDKFAGPLRDVGGKGLFTKELEEALLENRIDIAVHSVKDMATRLPEGLMLTAVLPRGDARDVLISRNGETLATLPKGAVIGTASLRRQALLQHYRPDLQIHLFRGNVQTRLRKLADGEVDATLLALAGLQRLDMADQATEILEVDRFIPAVGQGAIGLECRTTDASTQKLLEPLNDHSTYRCIKAEREFLRVLDGSCRTPIGGYATSQEGQLHIRGFLGTDQGLIVDELQGPGDNPIQLGEALARKIQARITS